MSVVKASAARQLPPQRPSALAPPRISFDWESFSQGVQDALPVIRADYEACGLPYDLQPDWNRYAALELACALKCLVGRTEDGLVAGFATFVLSRMMHYPVFEAVADTWFLDPLYSQPFLCVRFFKKAHTDLKAAGLQRVRWHSADPRMMSVFRRVGCRAESVNYAKDL